MKKILSLTALVAVFTTGSALAASVPVTTFSPASAKVNAEYSFAQNVSNMDDHKTGYGASLEVGLTDKVAAQYAYSKVKSDNPNLSVHELMGIYKLTNNFNLYGGMTHLSGGTTSTGFQVGAIGHMPLAPKWNGFAKVGFGNDIKQTYSLGASYDLLSNLALNLYYQYDKYDYDNYNYSVKGFHAGVGLSF